MGRILRPFLRPDSGIFLNLGTPFLPQAHARATACSGDTFSLYRFGHGGKILSSFPGAVPELNLSDRINGLGPTGRETLAQGLIQGVHSSLDRALKGRQKASLRDQSAPIQRPLTKWQSSKALG